MQVLICSIASNRCCNRPTWCCNWAMHCWQSSFFNKIPSTVTANMTWSKNGLLTAFFFLHLLCEFGNSWVPSYQKLEQHMKARDILPRFEDIMIISREYVLICAYSVLTLKMNNFSWYFSYVFKTSPIFLRFRNSRKYFKMVITPRLHSSAINFLDEPFACVGLL